MTPLFHGGGVLAAMQAFPDAPTPWLDLSTGINPIPYPVGDIPPAAWSRLPQPEEISALERVAANAFGAGDHCAVVAASGVQTLIEQIPRIFPARHVVVLGPTYAEHEARWRAAGACVRTVASMDAIDDAETVVVVNPNNPDGRLVPTNDLIALAAQCAARGGRLIVDEAFADALPADASLCPGILDGAIVLRSFGKFYGLAGLRLGFAICRSQSKIENERSKIHAPHPEEHAKRASRRMAASHLSTHPSRRAFGAPQDEARGILAAPLRPHSHDAAKLRAALGPWPVSGPAIAIGQSALGDEAWRASAARRLATDADRLDKRLAQAGFEIIGGTSLFRLGRHPRAAVIHEGLCRHGILTRPFAAEPTWLRFGLAGPEPDWQRLRAALRAIG